MNKSHSILPLFILHPFVYGTICRLDESSRPKISIATVIPGLDFQNWTYPFFFGSVRNAGEFLSS